ncbi:fructose-6-phosphate aldolase [Candidatus Peregrinibacteria bacterium]|nr:fructose-6-phosphate aldolase [Candidatus Peregrinibacteria bacterium]
MQIFLDTADIKEIKKYAAIGIVDGITTNPSLVAKEGVDFKTCVQEICAVISGPVSAEVLSTDAEAMVKEGRDIATWAKNVFVKLPMTAEGLKACKILSGEGININVTLIFSASQALLAAKAGAKFVSPFVGRLDDINEDGMALISDIVDIFMNYDIQTKVLAASIRHPQHVLEAMRIGADIATMPASVLEKLMQHPLTDIGLQKFLEDWKKAKK